MFIVNYEFTRWVYINIFNFVSMKNLFAYLLAVLPSFQLQCPLTHFLMRSCCCNQLRDKKGKKMHLHSSSSFYSNAKLDFSF